MGMAGKSVVLKLALFFQMKPRMNTNERFNPKTRYEKRTTNNEK